MSSVRVVLVTVCRGIADRSSNGNVLAHTPSETPACEVTSCTLTVPENNGRYHCGGNAIEADCTTDV